MRITPEQYEILLKPLAPGRVSSRSQGGMSLSYLEAWDVKAHLIRIFGFTGWSADVLSAELMFEEQDERGRWNVGYKVLMRLTIHNPDEDILARDVTYTEAAVGAATLPQRGEAHDMAVKTAESDALKRCAINLGTQFGLSLYDAGNRKDVVKHTLVPPVGYEEAEPVPDPLPPADLAERLAECDTEQSLKAVWDLAVADGWLDTVADGPSARSLIVKRLEEIQGDDE